MVTPNCPVEGAQDRPEGSAYLDLVREVRSLRAQVAELALALGRPRQTLLDTKQLAAKWGVSDRFIERLVATGEIRPLYFGSARRFTPEAVETFEREASRTSRPRKRGRKLSPRGRRAGDRPAQTPSPRNQ